PNTVSVSGTFQLPFKLDALSTEVEIPSVPKCYPRSYPLPPHLMKRDNFVHLEYKVVVMVKKGWYNSPI
ncbi:hypothetical protein AX16_011046, partial [Volvariella volvacea WC 439]